MNFELEPLPCDEAATIAQVMQHAHPNQLNFTGEIGRTAINDAKEMALEAVGRAQDRTNEELIDDIKHSFKVPEANKWARKMGLDTELTDYEEIIDNEDATGAIVVLPFIDPERAHKLYQTIFEDPEEYQDIILKSAVTGLSYLTLVQGEDCMDLWGSLFEIVDRVEDIITSPAAGIELEEYAHCIIHETAEQMRQLLKAAEKEPFRMPQDFRLSWALLQKFLPREEEERTD